MKIEKNNATNASVFGTDPVRPEEGSCDDEDRSGIIDRGTGSA